jgi:hypothetical protein
MRSASLVAIAALFSSAFAGDRNNGGNHGNNGNHGPKKYVTSRELQKQISLKDLMAGSQKLQDIADAHGGNRAFGGGGHNATTEYLYQELKKTGYYNCYKQPFVELFTAATVITAANGEPFKGEYMTYGPSGAVEAPFVVVNNIGCTAADFPPEVAGNVALINRGECTFQIKAQNAKAAGASAAVIYNNVPGALSGTLGGAGDYAPTVGVSQEIGLNLLEKIAAGQTIASINVNSIQEVWTCQSAVSGTFS